MYEEHIQESFLLTQNSDVCHVVESGKLSNSIISVKMSTSLLEPDGGVL